MSAENSPLIRAQGIPAPQYWNPHTNKYEFVEGTNGATKVEVVSRVVLQEQLTESDAVSGTLTFNDKIHQVDIYNRDSDEGVFTINNLAITIPANTFFHAEIGGTPGNTVEIAGSTSYIIGRYA